MPIIVTMVEEQMVTKEDTQIVLLAIDIMGMLTDTNWIETVILEHVFLDQEN